MGIDREATGYEIFIKKELDNVNAISNFLKDYLKSVLTYLSTKGKKELAAKIDNKGRFESYRLKNKNMLLYLYEQKYRTINNQI